MTTTQAATLLEALGLTADADEPDLILATVADLAAQAAGITAEKPSTVAAAAKKAGLEVIDTDTADALRRDAAEGRKIAAAAARTKVEAAVDDAISHGRITPVAPQALGIAHRSRSGHGRRARLGAQRDRRPDDRARP